MAYNIKPLRQQNLFDNFSLGSLGDLSMSGYSYGDESQDVDPTNRSARSNQPLISTPDLSAFRGTNINPGSPPPPTSTREVIDPRETPEQRTKRMIDAIGQVYTPSNTARDRFGNLLDNPPERNEPSFMRKLVAAGVGLGNKGMGVAPSVGEEEKVLYAPYLRDMAEWNAKVSPYSQAAQQENTANSVERQLAGNLVTGMYNQDRIETQQRIADEKNATARMKIESDAKIQQDKRAVERIVAGGVKDVNFKGRNVVITMKDGTTFDTGVATTNYDPLEQEAMRQSGAMERVIVNNSAALARINASGADAYTDPDGNLFSVNPRTKQMTPIGNAPDNPTGPLTKIPTPTTLRPPSEANIAKGRENEIKKLYDTDQYARQFITVDENTGGLKPIDLPANASKEQQDGLAYVLSKLYPAPPKKDINLPLLPGQTKEVRGVTPGNIPTGGTTGGTTPELRQRAADYLKSHNMPITDANIETAIKAGRVR